MKINGTSLTPEVIDAINEELAYQETLRSQGRADDKDYGVAGQIVTLNVYTNEVNRYWVNYAGERQALDSLRKVAAIAIRALVRHGCPRRRIGPLSEDDRPL